MNATIWLRRGALWLLQGKLMLAEQGWSPGPRSWGETALSPDAPPLGLRKGSALPTPIPALQRVFLAFPVPSQEYTQQLDSFCFLIPS